MPSPNNLRIIYQNQVDLSNTIISGTTAASGTSIANLRSDTKSLVWRSSTSNTASIVLDLGSAKQISGVVLAFTNLASSNATIRLAGHASLPITISGGSIVVPSSPAASYNTVIQCCPWNNLALPSWGTNPVGSSNYSYGGGTHARAWLTPT